jgi:fatty-acid peroxygenase
VALFRHPHAPVLAQHAIPHTHSVDSTVALLLEGYRFITRRCDLFGSDIFATRFMLHRAFCVRGEEAARMFYEPGRFNRRHAIPPTMLLLKLDHGSVRLLDGDAHRKRKAMLMSLQGPAQVQRLVDLAENAWRAQFARWPHLPRVVLHHEAEAVLCRAACEWSGIPASDAELAQRGAEFSAMIEGAGSVGPRNWKGYLMRRRTERWMHKLVDAVRDGDIDPPRDTALYVIAQHREADGRLIARHDAAVEMINVLRPTVAVARYIVFGALALHDFPGYRAQLASADDDWLRMFAQEVRRYYPFFTMVGGRASAAFDWHGLHFEKNAWVLLDLYGTDHHPLLWNDPEDFRPERFARRATTGFDLIAQGGGDYLTGHRCSGEMATIELVKSALRLLATEIEYRVPPQDLCVSLSRMPTLPASGFVIDSVRAARAVPPGIH